MITNEVLSLLGAVVGVNARFEDGTTSLLLKVSEHADDLKPGSKTGQLVSLTVKQAVVEKGFCPGAQFACVASIEPSSKLRDDGTPWLRLRLDPSEKLQVTRKGSLALDLDHVEFS
jgi:hypothetical protein